VPLRGASIALPGNVSASLVRTHELFREAARPDAEDWSVRAAASWQGRGVQETDRSPGPASRAYLFSAVFGPRSRDEGYRLYERGMWRRLASPGHLVDYVGTSGPAAWDAGSTEACRSSWTGSGRSAEPARQEASIVW
jgi:hypothetical protein